MVALRSFCGPEGDVDARRAPNAADWLSLQQAACELGLSVSTVRRMIRRGQLRNRIVPRPGGFAYLIYLPNSRHAQLGAHDHRDAPVGSTRSGLRLVDAEFERDRRQDDVAPADEIRRLKVQVQHLSHALARAARPPGPAGAYHRGRHRRRHEQRRPVRPVPIDRPQAPLVAFLIYLSPLTRGENASVYCARFNKDLSSGPTGPGPRGSRERGRSTLSCK